MVSVEFLRASSKAAFMPLCRKRNSYWLLPLRPFGILFQSQGDRRVNPVKLTSIDKINTQIHGSLNN